MRALALTLVAAKAREAALAVTADPNPNPNWKAREAALAATVKAEKERAAAIQREAEQQLRELEERRQRDEAQTERRPPRPLDLAPDLLPSGTQAQRDAAAREAEIAVARAARVPVSHGSPQPAQKEALGGGESPAAKAWRLTLTRILTLTLQPGHGGRRPAPSPHFPTPVRCTPTGNGAAPGRHGGDAAGEAE